MEKGAGETKIAIVTVHGTGDSAPSLDGPKWFQRGSHFSEALKQRLLARSLSAEISPFLWSGANSASEREKGSERLAATIKRIAPNYSSVHVLGHSHGGNVANDAAVLLRWGRRKQRVKEPITSLTTIGTPFLNSRTSMSQSIGGLLFLAITWASVPLYILMTVLLLVWALAVSDYAGLHVGTRALGFFEGLFEGMPAQQAWLIFWLCAISTGLPLLYMLRLATRGLRRIMRPRASSDARASVFAVMHGNDEAISFLQKIEKLPLEPFPRGSLMRGSRGMALNAGVLTVIIASLAPASIYAGARAGWISMPNANWEWFWTSTLSLLFAAPLLFLLFYLLVRFVAGGGGEIVARPRLNNWVGGVLRGVAYGRDGDQAIGEVTTSSHTYATKEHLIEGSVAERMQTNAGAAAAKLIETYRWSLFTIGADSNGPLANLANDAMTWESLIHTTYFDQPEVVALIADYIADEIDRPAPALG
jgi:hypothetical protein